MFCCRCCALNAALPPALPAAGFVLQARAAAGCGMRYLGASATNCTNQETGLYALANPLALLKWQLIRV